MKKIKKYVYRIENKSMRGPWMPGLSAQWSTNSIDLPLPHIMEFGASILDDILPGYLLCTGCKNVSQLRRWFSTDEIKRLYELGFYLVKIVPSKILRSSKNQVVFTRKPSNETIIIDDWQGAASLIYNIPKCYFQK